jgi:hypothetical protein
MMLLLTASRAALAQEPTARRAAAATGGASTPDPASTAENASLEEAVRKNSKLFQAKNTRSLFDPPVDAAAPTEEYLPQMARDSRPPDRGLLRQTSAFLTWIEGDDLGFTDVDTKAIFALPTFSEDAPLILTPGYSLHVLDGPSVTDLPGQLHDFYLDTRWIVPFSPTMALDMGITPGWFSDLETGNDDAFRLGARLVGVFTCSPTLKFAVGVAYLDRDDVEFFPLGGVIWTPSEDSVWDLTLPRPKIAQRFWCDEDCERWWYVAGEFGGGSWAIGRASGAEDVVNYYDLRVMLGLEQKNLAAGTSGLFEVGYVFNRRLEYESGFGDFDPGDTFLVRAGMAF